MIIPDRVLRTRKQSEVRRILKVCKKRAHVSAVNTCSQISVRNNSIVMPEIALLLFQLFIQVTRPTGVVSSMISH